MDGENGGGEAPRGHRDGAEGASESPFSEDELPATRERLRRIAASILSDGVVAADIAQQAVEILLARNRAGMLAGLESLASYADQVARHLAYEEVRRRRARRAKVVPMDFISDLQLADRDPGSPYSQPMQHLQKRQDARALVAAIQALAMERDRQLLMGVYLYGRDRAGLARELGIGRGHFRKVLSRARLRLRQELERRGHDPKALLDS